MKHYNETYNLEIVKEPSKDGLTRPGLVTTKATGLSELYFVEEILSIFNSMVEKIPGSKVKLERVMKFYCHACRGLIGEKAIPLRIENYKIMGYKNDPVIDLQIEEYKCASCGHHTRYSVQDPIVRCY